MFALCSLAPAAAAARPASPGAHARVARACRAPRPRHAACMSLRLIPGSLSAADLHSNAIRFATDLAHGAIPAVTYTSPWPGYLTPQSLHAAYSLPAETPFAAAQTIAVVDAFNDPTAEADLAVYDTQFGLPACTTANGCFKKVNEEGKASPLPPTEGGWATEISLDVQMAHAICQGCHVLLVEARSEEFNDLGRAVDAAAAAGATEISNSYGGGEESGLIAEDGAYYEHPGTVLTASTGDCGYLNDSCFGYPSTANFPAVSPDVVAVGGTSLTDTKGVWASSAWREGGSGCSTLLAAAPWQAAVANFAATGCGANRSVADVAAIGDPDTGVDVYDSTPESSGAPTGWGVWGGTSVASPIVAAEYALAGGAHGVSQPASDLYAHFGESGALYDVAAGINGSCGGTTECIAVEGFDGPTGVGSPIGLGAFGAPGSPESLTPPAIAGAPQLGLELTASPGTWAGAPAGYTYQWERCKRGSCQAIAGATASTYTPVTADVGSTERVSVIASNSVGYSPIVDSAQTATVASDVPKATGLTPGSGITGSSVTITGTALNGATRVAFGAHAALYTIVSATEIEAIVPDGATPARVTVTTPGGKAAAPEFTPTLSVKSFAPASDPPGKTVTIRGLGFNATSGVSFGGVPSADVTYVSAAELKASIPAGAASGAITVTNSSAPAGTVSGARSFSVT